MGIHAFAPMTGWEFVEVEGPDAQDFLHRLTTINLKTMEPDKFSPAMVLHATGKVIAYFKLLMIDREHFLLLVPPAAIGGSASPDGRLSPSALVFEALEKLHFSENLTIRPIAASTTWQYLRVVGSDLEVLDKVDDKLGIDPRILKPGEFLKWGKADLLLNESRWTTTPICFDFGLVVAVDRLGLVTNELLDLGFSEMTSLEPFRIRAADPAVPDELGPQTIPLEAGMDDAVHQNKGCYPGQEVIERIRAMGQTPRRLAQIRGTGNIPHVPCPVVTSGQTAGTLTSAATDPIDGGWIGLALIKRMFANPTATSTMNFAVGDQTVRLSLKNPLEQSVEYSQGKTPAIS